VILNVYKLFPNELKNPLRLSVKANFSTLKTTNMKTSEIYTIIEKLPKEQRLAITLLVEEISDKNAEKIMKEFDLMNVAAESMIEIALKNSEHELDILQIKYDNLNIKYNVLIGAIALIASMIGILNFLK
tara:strand:- start:22322 stop:22711 length:390 start_codon:yes stop_codon:yes gene_type:complete